MLICTGGTLSTWAQMRKFDPVFSANLRWMQDWLLLNGTLKAKDKVPWLNTDPKELLTLSPKLDKLDSWLAQFLVPLWQSALGERLKVFRNQGKKAEEDPERQRETFRYGPKALALVGDVCCLFVSSTILVGAITALNFSKTTQARLVLLSVFNVLFSCILMFVARCRRFEVFAGTATFCAVMIVFLQGIGQGTNG
jgi:hypothetical protein